MKVEHISDYFTPSILLSEVLFPYLDENHVMADAVGRIANEGFYGGAEISILYDNNDKKIIRGISESYNFSIIQWFTFLLIEEKIDISSLDEINRKRSTRRIIETLNEAAHCGAQKVGLISGDDPGAPLRSDAYKATYQSLCEICDAAQMYNISIIIEPLDRQAHKNKLVGPTTEAVDLIKSIKPFYSNIGLSWDTAHAALCEEDILGSMGIASKHITQLHLANAVLDKNDKMFGDHHMAMGYPGFLTKEKAVQVFRKAIDISFFGKNKPCVSIETRTINGTGPWETERRSRDFLVSVWEMVNEGDNE